MRLLSAGFRSVTDQTLRRRCTVAKFNCLQDKAASRKKRVAGVPIVFAGVGTRRARRSVVEKNCLPARTPDQNTRREDLTDPLQTSKSP